MWTCSLSRCRGPAIVGGCTTGGRNKGRLAGSGTWEWAEGLFSTTCEAAARMSRLVLVRRQESDGRHAAWTADDGRWAMERSTGKAGLAALGGFRQPSRSGQSFWKVSWMARGEGECV